MGQIETVRKHVTKICFGEMSNLKMAFTGMVNQQLRSELSPLILGKQSEKINCGLSGVQSFCSIYSRSAAECNIFVKFV